MFTPNPQVYLTPTEALCLYIKDKEAVEYILPRSEWSTIPSPEAMVEFMNKRLLCQDEYPRFRKAVPRILINGCAIPQSLQLKEWEEISSDYYSMVYPLNLYVVNLFKIQELSEYTYNTSDYLVNLGIVYKRYEDAELHREVLLSFTEKE